MSQKPLVSICCITYNHENYIRDCIEGFLMQETTFPFEILIFDDASTDCTQSIIQEYADKYTNIITFLQTENQWSKGRYGLFEWLFPNAKGDYIALCEGDDYWTSPSKLQMQVEFLEKNKEYTVCGHCTYKLFVDSTIQPMKCQEGTVNLFDGLTRFTMHTSSLVFRAIREYHFIKILKKYPIGDAFIVCYLLSIGKGYVFGKPMSVYRVHDGGVHSSLSDYNMNITAIKIQARKIRFFPLEILAQLENIYKYYRKIIIRRQVLLEKKIKLTVLESFFVVLALLIFTAKGLLNKVKSFIA